MLTIRPFRNEDPPKLLEIWQRLYRDRKRPHFIPMSMADLDCGPLGMPLFDHRFIQLAFRDDQPVGFAQIGFGPNTDGSDLSSEVGHIAVVAVVPDCLEPVDVCKELIVAGENVLTAAGVRKIFGGSPHPCLPFYLGLYGGAEPIGIFDSDEPVVEAFQQLGYEIRQKTIHFQRELINYKPPMHLNDLQWKDKIVLQVDDVPIAKNWWDALSLAHNEWLEFTAVLTENSMRVAQVRVRLSLPGPDKIQRVFDNDWDAALTDIRVHPNFHRKGLGTFVLGIVLRFLSRENRAARIEAHIADDHSTVYRLLRALDWEEVETGNLFYKNVH